MRNIHLGFYIMTVTELSRTMLLPLVGIERPQTKVLGNLKII